MILPRSAAIDGAHEPAELDPDQEHVGVGRVGRDPAHVRGPWARREAPRRSRRQLQKRLQLPPGRTAIVAAKERARFGSGIHSAVDRTYRKREDPRRRQLAVDPTAAAVSGPPDASLAEPGVGDVGIVWIDGEALSAAAAERERDIPRSVALVEARDSVTGRAIQTSHSVTLSATSLAGDVASDAYRSPSSTSSPRFRSSECRWQADLRRPRCRQLSAKPAAS